MSLPSTSRVSQYQSADGTSIYSISITVFDDFRANVYLIDHPDALILIDSGSGMGRSNRGIEEGLNEISQLQNRDLSLSDIDLVLITHGHIDHFGGLPFLAENSQAPCWVNPRDSRILSDFRQRMEETVANLNVFLEQAAVPEAGRQSLIDVYRWGKDHYSSQQVEPRLEAGILEPFGFRIYHTPGHCPGQVCIQLDDVLFTGDHVLSRISPHLAPESITPYTGLRTYLKSLRQTAELKGIRVALGGHEAPIQHLGDRCQEIETLHFTRLEEVFKLCSRPTSILELSRQLFGELRSYHILLGLEEAGALLEYLVQEGRLSWEKTAEGAFLYSQGS